VTATVYQVHPAAATGLISRRCIRKWPSPAVAMWSIRYCKPSATCECLFLSISPSPRGLYLYPPIMAAFNCVHRGSTKNPGSPSTCRMRYSSTALIRADTLLVLAGITLSPSALMMSTALRSSVCARCIPAGSVTTSMGAPGKRS